MVGDPELIVLGLPSIVSLPREPGCLRLPAPVGPAQATARQFGPSPANPPPARVTSPPVPAPSTSRIGVSNLPPVIVTKLVWFARATTKTARSTELVPPAIVHRD